MSYISVSTFVKAIKRQSLMIQPTMLKDLGLKLLLHERAA